MKGPPPRHSTLKPPTPVARQGTLVKRSRLRLELTLALMFKVLALTVLWFAFFRPDPDHPRPSPDDLFTRSVPSIDQGVSR